jgi:hypothetical protein
MRRVFTAALLALALAGCGSAGGEDFAVAIKRPLPTVYAALGTAELSGEAIGAFPELKVVKTRPSEHEIVYTIPGDGGSPAVIRFLLEPADGGGSTLVRTSVDVPSIRVKFKGKEHVLSEWRVERTLRSILDRASESMAMGSDRISNSDMQGLLLALAIGTNKKLMAELESNPASLESRFAGLGGRFWDDYLAEKDAETADRPEGDRAQGDCAEADVDPNADAAKAQAADAPDTSEEPAAVAEAADADDARGESAGGEEPGGQ